MNNAPMNYIDDDLMIELNELSERHIGLLADIWYFEKKHHCDYIEPKISFVVDVSGSIVNVERMKASAKLIITAEDE